MANQYNYIVLLAVLVTSFTIAKFNDPVYDGTYSKGKFFVETENVTVDDWTVLPCAPRVVDPDLQDAKFDLVWSKKLGEGLVAVYYWDAYTNQTDAPVSYGGAFDFETRVFRGTDRSPYDLKIQSVKKSDEGIYCCHLSHGDLWSEQCVHLSVESRGGVSIPARDTGAILHAPSAQHRPTGGPGPIVTALVPFLAVIGVMGLALGIGFVVFRLRSRSEEDQIFMANVDEVL